MLQRVDVTSKPLGSYEAIVGKETLNRLREHFLVTRLIADNLRILASLT